MNILAFESSCDETAAAVVSADSDGFTVKSNIVASQIETHRLYGGVVPEIASRAHAEVISRITYEALSVAKLSINEIDLVAVTANPGLIGALLVGVNFAKGLAFSKGIPLVAVDHIKGHIAANYLEEEMPEFPFISLVSSGGHTSIYKVDSPSDIKIIGATRDDAIGESFDKIGRLLGIPYPAGRGFDELAREGFIEATGDENNFYSKYKKSDAYKNGELTLPSPALSDGTLDFSFSGLKTAAINLINRYKLLGRTLPRALFAARYTFEAVEAVVKQLSRALDANPDCHAISISGGVAANSHLRRRVAEIAEQKGAKTYIPPLSFCGDNAAMIAAAAYFEYEKGNIAPPSLNASAQDSIK